VCERAVGQSIGEVSEMACRRSGLGSEGAPFLGPLFPRSIEISHVRGLRLLLCFALLASVQAKIAPTSHPHPTREIWHGIQGRERVMIRLSKSPSGR
jgi:hypothetical protein